MTHLRRPTQQHQVLIRLRVTHLLKVCVCWIILTSGQDFILFSASKPQEQMRNEGAFILLMQYRINNYHVAIMNLAYNSPGISHVGLHPLLIILPYLFRWSNCFFLNLLSFFQHNLLKRENIPSFFWICTKVLSLLFIGWHTLCFCLALQTK